MRKTKCSNDRSFRWLTIGFRSSTDRLKAIEFQLSFLMVARQRRNNEFRSGLALSNLCGKVPETKNCHARFVPYSDTAENNQEGNDMTTMIDEADASAEVTNRNTGGREAFD